jgi:outer membrane protein OmpA-like peptidoglycan-associated protein
MTPSSATPYRTSVSGPALALALLLVACASAPVDSPELRAARAGYSQARSDPFAARAAAVELERAQQALLAAEATAARDEEQRRHLAYLALRRSQAAMALGQQARAEQQVQQAGAERERLRLQAGSTREPEPAARQALIAQADAAQLQRQARLEAERAAQLESDLQPLQGRRTERGLVVALSDVLFVTGRAELQPGARRTAQQLATVLRQYPERRILIGAVGDSASRDQTNLELSRRRAEAFREALLTDGVSPHRIELQAHGEDSPVADRGTAASRPESRRLELLFSDVQGRFPKAGAGTVSQQP